MAYEAIIIAHLMIGAVLGFARIEIWSSRGRLLPTEDRWNARRVFFYLWFPLEAVVLDDVADGSRIAWAMNGPACQSAYIAGYAIVWPVPTAFCIGAVLLSPVKFAFSYASKLVTAARARNQRLEERRRRAEVRKAILAAARGPRFPDDSLDRLARLVRKRESLNRRIETIEMRIVAREHAGSGVVLRRGLD